MITCAACGAPAPAPFSIPSSDQSPDLDLRPGEPARSTIGRWIATCRACLAAAPDLSAPPAGAAATVGTADYRALAADLVPALGFLRWAALSQAAGDRAQAGEAMLRAAWMADDAQHPDAARWRLAAAEAWAELTEPSFRLRRVDVLRRAARFDAAAEAAEAAATAAGDDPGSRVITFQRARIAARDAGRHLMASALRPPARMPHVAHGKVARGKSGRPGWLGRLLGRE